MFQSQKWQKVNACHEKSVLAMPSARYFKQNPRDLFQNGPWRERFDKQTDMVSLFKYCDQIT